jgi:hypothetical protein
VAGTVFVMGFLIVYFNAVGVDAEVTLITLLLINTTAIVKTIPRIIQMKNIRLNATTLGNNCSSPFTIPGTRNICTMTPDIIGPIAPPIILRVFITAAEVPIISFGINKIIMASRVLNQYRRILD